MTVLRVSLRDDLSKQVRGEKFSDGGDRPQDAEGEPSIEVNDSAFEQAEVGLDICEEKFEYR